MSVTEGGSDPGSFTLIADDLKLRVAQWDIDGETNYKGSPRTVFLDGSVGGLQIDTTGKLVLHANTNGGATFEGFQLRIPSSFLGLLGEVANPFVDALQFAGCARLHDDHMELSMPWASYATRNYAFAKGKEWGACS